MEPLTALLEFEAGCPAGTEFTPELFDATFWTLPPPEGVPPAFSLASPSEFCGSRFDLAVRTGAGAEFA
jgi:hypothetical protein